MEKSPRPLSTPQKRLAAALTVFMLAVAALLAMAGVARNQVGETLFGTGLFLSLLPWLRMPEVYFFRIREPLRRGALSDGPGRMLQTLALVGLALLALSLGGRLLAGLFG